MFFLYFLSSVILVLIFIKEPMQLLLTVMAFMLIIIMKMFLESLDYWTMFIMILSFLVGLFLMFVYMVSFSKKQIFSSSFFLFPNKNFLLLITLLLSFIFFTDMQFMTIFSSSKTSTFSWYEKWTQEKSEIVLFFVIAFFFLVMLMFYMMKKAKKSMKSSV